MRHLRFYVSIAYHIPTSLLRYSIMPGRQDVDDGAESAAGSLGDAWEEESVGDEAGLEGEPSCF